MVFKNTFNFKRMMFIGGTIILLFLILKHTGTFYRAGSQPNKQNPYSFIVAGHPYGSHHGTNMGLYPKFLNHLRSKQDLNFEFIILNGDIVRQSIAQSWRQVQKELNCFEIPYYFVMGNHDYSEYGQKLFVQMYGQTYYSFNRQTETFIILDTQQQWGQIPPNQMAFLKQCLKNNPQSTSIFIFFHELIWTAQTPKYKHIRHNYVTYDNQFKSNFWSDLYPLLVNYPEKNIYIIAGDVGGNPGVIPAFYEKIGHITLLATGMGQIRDENYLLVNIDNTNVTFELIPLNANHQLSDLTSYTVLKDDVSGLLRNGHTHLHSNQTRGEVPGGSTENLLSHSGRKSLAFPAIRDLR